MEHLWRIIHCLSGKVKRMYWSNTSENWKTPHDIKRRYRSVDFLADNRVIFDIKGNSYQLVVKVRYQNGLVVVEWVDRIHSRPRKAISAYLIQDDNGQPLSQIALRSRFDKARTLAKVEFQFRDISGQGGHRHRRPSPFTKAAGSQEPRYDRALR